MRLTSYLASNLFKRKSNPALNIKDLNDIFTQMANGVLVLSADSANANVTPNTLADLPDLVVPLKAGKTYKFKYVLNFSAAATTTGPRFTINGPAAPTILAYRSQYSLTTTSETVNAGLAAYQLPAAPALSSAATTGNTAIVEGIIKPSVDGTLVLQFSSEITLSAITVVAGSYVEYEEITVS